jgi:hypothetical protein
VAHNGPISGGRTSHNILLLFSLAPAKGLH